MLYCNVHDHDFITGDLLSQSKEKLLPALEDQMEIGEEGPPREDEYLLVTNLENLDSLSGEDQAIWLLPFQAAKRHTKSEKEIEQSSRGI